MPWLSGIGNVENPTINYFHPHCCGKGENIMTPGLFEVWIVDPKENTIIWSATGKDAFVANGEKNAELRAVQAAAEDNQLQLPVDNYDIMVRCIGSLRPRG